MLRASARTPTSSTSASSAKRMITPFGRSDGDGAAVVVHRAKDLDADDRQQHDRRDSARDGLVVALARVAPAALVDAREHEHRQAAADDPPDRAFAQVLVVARRAVLEAQLEGEVVRDRDQHPIHRELG